MIYEIRVYEAEENCAAAMRERFLTHVAPRMPGHGIELLGVFTAPEEDGRLTYMTRFADEAARVEAWASFSRDEEWLAIKRESERAGPLLASQAISVLRPAADRLPLA